MKSQFDRLAAFCEEKIVKKSSHSIEAMLMAGASKKPVQASVRFLCTRERCSANGTLLLACYFSPVKKSESTVFKDGLHVSTLASGGTECESKTVDDELSDEGALRGTYPTAIDV